MSASLTVLGHGSVDCGIVDRGTAVRGGRVSVGLPMTVAGRVLTR